MTVKPYAKIGVKKQKGPVIEGILNDLTTEGCKFEFNAKTQEFKSDWIFSENWG
jgi:hypothetical protein